MRIEKDIGERISILRIVLIYGIIVLHMPPYIPLTETGTSTFDLIKALMQHAVFRCSVPMLTFLSGFLLFSFDLDQHFKALVVKKTKTILWPLILFNIPVAFAVYIVQSQDLLDHTFSKQLYPFDPSSWVNAITGLTGETINYPLNFLRDLFVISIAAPLFGLFLRNFAWLGLVVVFVVFWNNWDGQIVLRNMMPINFYMGGMAAILAWNLRKLDLYAPYLFLIFIAICITVVVWPIENRNFLRLIAPIMIWPASSLLVNTIFGDFLSRLSKYSFAIFLLHGPLLLVAWVLYAKFLHSTPYPIFWLLAPMLTSLIIIFFYTYFYRWFPKTTGFALGGR